MSILVLDIGTTSMRGILYDHAGNKRNACQLPNRINAGADGWVSEPASDWEENTVRIISSIMEQAAGPDRNIEAVAVSSQRSSIIPVDISGQPLMDAIMWQDTRNREICRELEAYNEECFARTGSYVNSVFSGSKMTWVRRERPDIYEKVHKFLNIPEYIVFRMTGEFCSDYTYASRSGLFNLAEKTWDPLMLSIYEVDPDKLCRLYEPGSIVGRTTGAFEERTGLPAGTPVMHCGGDQQCAAVGQGVTREGNVSIVLGTGGFLITACDRIPAGLTSNVLCNASAVKGKYILEANVLACSAAFDWFARQFYGMEEIDYPLLEQELRQQKEIAESLVIPYFEGRGAPDWNAGARAVFSNISLATTRRELLTAMMEGIFMEIANHIDSFSGYVRVEKIFISGGMSGNGTLARLLCDVLGREICVPEDAEATAFGAFLIAMTGLGHYRSADDAVQALTDMSAVKVYSPDKEKHIAYEEKRRKMNALYENNRNM